jgi:hypothetical protein
VDRTRIPQEPVKANNAPAAHPPDESLVSDARAGLTPAQLVERRLVALLKSAPLPLSRLQAGRVPRPRP